MQCSMENLTDRQRNYGIDLFRIISMMMIPTIHVLGHGGILENSVTFSAHYELAWLLEILAYCSVDSYALISGYVGFGKKQKYSNIIYLYLQVIFYTGITTISFAFCKPELVGFDTIKKAIFPFSYFTYWYFSAYVCLFFFMPFLNEIVDRFEKYKMEKLLFSSFIIFSLLPTVFHSDIGNTNGGFSFLWIAILYVAGAYIKKYGVFIFESNWKNMLGYLGCVTFLWLSKLSVEAMTYKLFHEPKAGGYLISYSSPIVLFCSIFLLLFFAKLNCGRKLTSFIKYFAPVSFGVYLFHEEPLVRETFIKKAFINYLSFNPIVMVFAVVGTALSIWLIGSLIDRIRLKIFDYLKVKQFCVFIEKKLASIKK